MNLELRVIRNHQHKACPICQENHHPFNSRIIIEVEVEICSECFMLRKEAFWYLRDHVNELRIGDLQNLGLLSPAQK